MDIHAVLLRDQAVLVGVYEKFGNRTPVTFTCVCGNNRTKNLETVLKTGAHCIDCAKGIKSERLKAAHANRSLEVLEATIEKRKATNLKKYGGNAPSCSTAVVQKTKNTNIERYGGAGPMCSEDVKAKSRQKCLEVYGFEHPLQSPEILEKRFEHIAEKYGGVRSTSQLPEFNAKKVTTNLLRYGVSNPTQNPEILDKALKNSKSTKNFTMPSGDVRTVQGYEPFALKRLLTIYSEEQIKTGRKYAGSIVYESNGKTHTHYPDIFIPHLNKYIEVKSPRTYELKEDNVLLKKQAAESLGFIYEIWIFDGKGNLVKVIPTTPSP